MLVDAYLRDSAQRHPAKEVLICGTRRTTYGELEDGSNALAHAFRKLGLQRQDRTVICHDNSAETVQGIFATLKASGIFAVINPQVKGDKLAFIINDCNARILLTGRRYLQEHATELLACNELRHIVVLDGGVDGEPVFTSSRLKEAGKAVHSLAELSAGESVALPGNANIDLDLAALIYTSGSTGLPKGVMLTHLNMVTAATSLTTYLGNVADDIILSPLPLAFDYGLYQVLMAIRFGGTVVLEKQFMYPYRYIELVKKERVTGLPIVPTITAILLNLKDLDDHDFSSVRYVTNTAQALPEHHIRRLRTIMPNARIYSMYGLTECKRVAYLPPELIDRKPTSVGMAIPNTEAWIEDDAGNRIATAGQVGELIVRGSHVMVGYWNRPEETSRYLRPGRYPHERELRTGDLFRQDEDGHLYFVSRRDDLIKTAGERVGPREVENVLQELESVREAAVIGIPDPILGSAIKAFVSVCSGTTLSEEEVIRHCQRRLEKYKVPKQVVFMPELPKTSSGKISKQGLS